MGECENNKKYMLKYCRPSCQVCVPEAEAAKKRAEAAKKTDTSV